jgi:hypothetical protein
MKKVLIVLALVALAIVPVAAKGFGIGLEAGNPSGVTFAYDIDEKWDGYATVGFAFASGALDAVVGGQYEVANFEIGKAEFDVNVGAQAGIFTNFKSLGIAVRGTGSIDYDWTWKDVGDFTAYLRLGFGVGIGLTGDSAGAGFSWSGALGCVYYL